MQTKLPAPGEGLQVSPYLIVWGRQDGSYSVHEAVIPPKHWHVKTMGRLETLEVLRAATERTARA